MQEMNSSRILIEAGRAQAGVALFLQCYAVRVTWALMQSPAAVMITQMHEGFLLFFWVFLLQCNSCVNAAVCNATHRKLLKAFKKNPFINATNNKCLFIYVCPVFLDSP